MRASAHSLVVYAEDERVATHPRRGPGYRSTIEGHLPDHRADLRHRSRAFWEQRAEAMGPQVLHYVSTLFDSNDVLSQLRAVQAIVTHLETFPKERACAACLRAEHFGGYSYRTVRNILRQGLDLEPLPEALPPPPASPAPRFARPQNQWRH